MWPFGPGSTQESQPSTFQSISQQIYASNDSNSFHTQAHERSQPAWPELETIKWKGYREERLGVPIWARVPLMMTASGICGLALGAAKGGPTAGDRYRAENAHRFPVSRSGWYLYHKTKNYYMIIGSTQEGVKVGLRLMGWATLFGVTEEVIDRSRARLFAKREEDEERVSGQRDAINTIMAALTVAGVYSWKSGLDRFSAARMSKMAIKYSLVYGLAQDTLASLRGSPPAYVSWLVGKTFGNSPKSEMV